MTITLNGTTGITNTGALSVTGITTLGALGSSVITSGTAVASTSGTSIDFTSIPTWVKRITVMFKSISTSGTSAILVQIGYQSPVTTTGYSSSSIIGTVANSVSGNNSASGFIISNLMVAANYYDGVAIINSFGSNTWVASSTLVNSNSSSVGYVGAGSIALGGTLDRVRVTTANGTDTFDLGSINILYE